MAFRSSYLKQIPIIWLPQDSNELDAGKDPARKPFFANNSLNEFPITNVEDLPLWRQSEIRKKRFRRRQQRFNEHRKQVRFSKGPGWHGTTEDFLGSQTLPHLVRTNSAHCPCKDAAPTRSRSFLPKVHSRKPSYSSSLAEILTTSALQPISHQQNFKMNKVQCEIPLVPTAAKCEASMQSIYGKHPQLPSICKPDDDEEDVEDEQPA